MVSQWSGPLFATTFTVPPDWGLAALAVVGAAGAAGPLDVAAEPVELVELGAPDELLELDEHAARPPAAMAATASAAMRREDLDIGMGHVPLGFQSSCRAEAAIKRPRPAAITAYREILRYLRSNPDQNKRCGLIVI